MKMFSVTVCLSADFRRTCLFMSGDGFEQAARDGVYGDGGFNLRVRAEDHAGAANVAFEVCNSSVDELHCEPVYKDQVEDYRAAGNRSLSVGDALLIKSLDGRSPEDGRYGCKSFGWERF